MVQYCCQVEVFSLINVDTKAKNQFGKSNLTKMLTAVHCCRAGAEVNTSATTGLNLYTPF